MLVPLVPVHYLAVKYSTWLAQSKFHSHLLRLTSLKIVGGKFCTALNPAFPNWDNSLKLRDIGS
jgi:hypothetical protein